MKKICLLLFSFLCVLCFALGLTIPTVALAETNYRLKLYDETSEELTFTGDWTTMAKSGWLEGNFYRVDSKTASISWTFTSEKIFLMGGVSDDGVQLSVSIDGAEAVVSNPINKDAEVVFSATELSNAEHEITVEISQADKGKFRFDGFYVQKEAIGEGTTYIDCSDASISYTMMAAGSNYYFIDDKSGGKVSYSFDATNVCAIDIMADKNADSAQIEIYIDGERIDKINLKGSGVSNTCVYTIGQEYLDPTASGKKITMEIRVAYVNGNSYFVFYGLNVHKYFNEDDWDKDNYVLDETPVADDLVKVEKDGNSANVSTTMANAGGVLSNTSTSDTLTYYFKGSAIEIIADKMPSGGKFEVSIDDKRADKVNLYSETTEQGAVVYRATGLAGYMDQEYVHKVQINVIDEKSWWSEGNIVVIRGFNVYKQAKTDEEYVDYDQFDMKADPDYVLPQDMEYKDISANSYSATGFGSTNGMYFTNTVGANLSIVFRGTGIEVYGELGPDKGKADVYIDGVLVGRMNAFSSVPAANVLLFRVTGLTQSNHSCMIEVVSQRATGSLGGALGGYISVMNAKAINTVGDVDNSMKIDSANYLVRSDGFGTDTHSGYYGGTALFSNDMSESTFLKVAFRGSSIKIYGTKNTDAGIATVVLDGETYTYNGRSDKYIVSTMLTEISGLDPNVNHELIIMIESENNPVGSKAYITIDYFDIENYSEVVFEGYKEIDDEHKDCGEDPVLPWREASVEDLREATTDDQPETPVEPGCGSVLGGSAIFGMVTLLGTGLLINKKKNQEEK